MLAELFLPAGGWTLVGGKGGVGKTTVAAALAIASADRGEPTLLISVDPAHSLSDALESPLAAEPREVPGAPGLRAMELDVERERAAFYAEHGEALAALLERGTYLAADEVRQLVDLTLPGADELAALFRLIGLVRTANGGRVIVDTAPTGHTLRLLAAPRLAREWLGALEALEARHQAVARAFGGAPAGDHTARFLEGLRSDLDAVLSRLTDVGRTRFLLVTTPEPVVLAETRRYRAALADLDVPLGGIIVNRVLAAPGDAGSDLIARAGPLPFATPSEVPVAFLPLLGHEPRGLAALRSFALSSAAVQARAAPAEPHGREVGESRRLRIGARFTPPADRRIYLIGGKGGVGKTTIASALALQLAQRAARPVLLLSTDPAGSLADVWGVDVGGEPRAAPGVPALWLRQLDAAADWERFRGEYRDEMRRFFERLLGDGAADADRAVAERLIDLAPPGIDELIAMLEVVDLAADPVYNALVLDTAPTGHLLRLLEMPGLALQWAHAILRLLLRYREVMGLGDVAERILGFARAVRGLRTLLQDRAQTLVAVVAHPEALSVAETQRLLPRLRGLHIDAEVLFVNRLLLGDGSIETAAATQAHALLAADGPGVRVAAPSWEAGPRGADQLERFAAGWRRLEPA